MRVRLWGVLVLIGVLVAVPMDGAEAKKRKKRKPVALGPVVTQTQTVPVGAESLGAATASCPAGTNLVGGGFAATPIRATGGSNFIYESRREGTASWTVRSRNSRNVAGTLTAEAYCRTGAPLLSEQSDRVTIPAASGLNFLAGNSGAVCPGGTRAVAGGFTATIVHSPSASNGPIVTDAYRLSEATFDVTAINTADVARDITALAYCSRTGRSEVSTTVDLGGFDNPVSAQSPVCPASKQKVKRKKKGGRKRKPKLRTVPTVTLAGGFRSVLGITSLPFFGVFVGESRLVSGVWRASGVSIGSRSTEFTALGFCGP